MNKILVKIVSIILCCLICSVSFCEQKEKETEIGVPVSTDNLLNKQVIIEVDELLNKLSKAIEEDDKQEIEINYHLFLDKINSVSLDSSVINYLLTDCQNMTKKIKNIYGMDTTQNCLSSNVGEISLEYDQEILDKWFNIYTTSGKKTIRAALERSGKYIPMIEGILEEYGLPKELAYLPVVESCFKNTAVSKVKAVGLWQIMSHRAKALGLQINYWIDERKDPEKCTRAAARYLKELFVLLNDWHLALSAYNRGEYGLIRDMKFSNTSSIVDMNKRNAPPKETQNFLPQFIVSVMIARDPEKYGFTNLNYEKPLEYDTVIINKVIDLKIVAKCANTTVEKIRELNPAILAWCTPHGYKDFELKLPVGTGDTFLQNIEKEKDLNPSPGYVKYKVKKGDCLDKIATIYKTTSKEIVKDNPKIKKKKYLKPGDILLIRPGRKYYTGK